MDKTNINALVQSIEHSLHLIYKNIFWIKQYQFHPNLAWICLKNHAVLRHCVFVDGCVYTFTLDGQKWRWGTTGSEGRTAKCAANEDETWLRPRQYMYCTYQMFFLAAAGVKNTASVFRWPSSTGEEKMDPISRWSLRMTGCQRKNRNWLRLMRKCSYFRANECIFALWVAVSRKWLHIFL